MKKIIIVCFCLSIFVLGCEDVRRLGTSIKSSAVGIEKKVVWTGFDGSKREWQGKFKIDSESNSPTIFFITEDGVTVVLGPGYYAEEIK